MVNLWGKQVTYDITSYVCEFYAETTIRVTIMDDILGDED